MVLDGERLRYTAPPGALTPEFKSRLQAHKPELLEWLGHRASGFGPDLQLFPVSFAQRRFWTLQKLNPDAAFYNVPFAFRIRGPLDVTVLRKSLNAIVNRHEILRTTLQERDGTLMQVIAPSGEMKLEFASVRNCPVPDRAAETDRILLAAMDFPFELTSVTGLRTLLVEVDRDDHILQFCFHNTVFDQTSLLVLLDEVSAHYSSFAAGTEVALPPPAQYREYVKWQDSFAGTRLEERRNYWREWFSRGEPPTWKWIPAKAPPEAAGFHTHTPKQRFSAELTLQLKDLSRRNGVTVYIILVALYAVLLRRYTGCPDITLGTTYSNRNRWEFSTLIGATIDVPALRIDTTGNPTLAALLDQVRTVVAAALTSQDVPFELVAPQLHMTRKPGPLFRVVFSFFPEAPHGRLKLEGAEVEFLEDVVNELSRPDLYLVLWENRTSGGNALTGYWMHKKDAFEAETAERMNAEWASLLAAAVARPHANVAELLASLS